MNPIQIPMIGYFGRWKDGTMPLVPGLFRWSTGLYSTDGRSVFGPFNTESDARFQLQVHLVRRNIRITDWIVTSLGLIALVTLIFCLLREYGK